MEKKDEMDSAFDHDSAIPRILDNKKSFTTYNIARLRELIRYLSPKKLELFHRIPFLLHINSPDFPGYVDSPLAPFGVFRFQHTGFWKLSLEGLKLSEKDLRPYLSDKTHILGLYLMGSSGTLGQTQSSDFDFWVLVDKSVAEGEQYQLLSRKLNEIEDWCRNVHDQHISFFILHPDQIRKNDFAAVDEESSGTAQKTILKEEFYRTFIMIAGKTPFWAVLPTDLDEGDYREWVRFLSNAKDTGFLPEDYVDLGNLTSINREECLGGILWQLYKARSDPIKALIKTSLLTYVYFFQEEEGLLCDEVKKWFPERGLDSHLLDPYTIVFEKVMNFFESVTDENGLELAKKCIFFRIFENPFPSDSDAKNPKKNLLKRYAEKWGWDLESISRLESYGKWNEPEKLAFDSQIYNKLSFLYELVLRAEDGRGPAFQMADSDLKMLKNRVASCYKQKRGKLPRCSSHLRGKAESASFLVAHEKDPSGRGFWAVYDGDDNRNRESKFRIFRGPEILQVVGWFLWNEIYTGRLSSVKFESKEPQISSKRAGILLDAAHKFFPSELPVPAHMAAEPVLNKIFVCVNEFSSYGEGALNSADFLFRNTWGEMFFEVLDLKDIDNNLLKYHKLAKKIWGYLQQDPEDKLRYQIHEIFEDRSFSAAKSIGDFIKDFKREIAGEEIVDPPEVEIPAASEETEEDLFLDLL